MPLTLEQLVTPTTADEIVQEVLDLCAGADPPLPVTSWQEGSVVLTMIEALADDIATRALVDVEIAKGGFGDLATGDWVKFWAEKIYNVIFVPAKPATGAVTFTNSTATPYSHAAGAVIVAHSVTGKTYRNQAAITIPALGSLAGVAISSDELGTANDAAPSFVTVIVSPSMPGVTVTNPAAVLGADEETAAAIVQRARDKLGSLSPNGPKEAFDYVAKTPELSPTSSPITRTKTVADPTTGLVTVYLATATGSPIAGDVTIVQAAIDEWAEPWTVGATAVAAVNLPIPVTYSIQIKSSLTQAQIQSAIATKLAEYLATVPVGGVEIPPTAGRVYLNKLEYVIFTALPGIELVTITVPGGDTAVFPNEVPVLQTVTATINFL